MNVVEHTGNPGVTLHGKTMTLQVHPGATTEEREGVLSRWYRRELKKLVPPLLVKWAPVVGVEVAEWGVKRMKTMWGACNAKARRIWINLELVKKPARCLEYIVVHELVHLRERHHEDRFISLMDPACGDAPT
jgi:predicted metal-dependent hydrolase